jgi:regulator of sirC expression with transglutaminase-like and TPR domain
MTKTADGFTWVEPPRPPSSAIPTPEELYSVDPDDFVARFTDIAAVNLGCAQGLPDCDDSQFPAYLDLLDQIAEAVRKATDRNWRLFKLKPKEFEHSEIVYRLYTMEFVFRTQFGVKYDPKVREATTGPNARDTWTSSDSTEVFIHGLLSEKRTGTCSSLPTFSIAVGRRLGYPLKLILCPRHTLYRWDDGTSVINLQPSDVGGHTRPDEFFHTWPEKWSADDFAMVERTKVWMHSMSPRQETSKFLCNRALLLREHGRFDEALRAIDAAARFNPVNPACVDIRYSIEYARIGCDPAAQTSTGAHQFVNTVRKSPTSKFTTTLGSSLGVAHWLPEGDVTNSFAMPLAGPVKRPQNIRDLLGEEAALAEEHFRLVNGINAANREPGHPHRNPRAHELTRQLSALMRRERELHR